MAQEYRQLRDPITGGIASTVLRMSDGAFIPFDGGNRDYQEYLAWLDKGNTPDPPGAGSAAETLPAQGN
jgi:hypothetical protein